MAAESSRSPKPPAWAVERARADLYDVTDEAAVTERAWEIVRDEAVRQDERHDEYDDPDRGGEG